MDVVTYHPKKAASPSHPAKQSEANCFGETSNSPIATAETAKGYRKVQAATRAQRNHWHGRGHGHRSSDSSDGSLPPHSITFLSQLRSHSRQQRSARMGWPGRWIQSNKTIRPSTRPPTRACGAVRYGACTSQHPSRRWMLAGRGIVPIQAQACARGVSTCHLS